MLIIPPGYTAHPGAELRPPDGDERHPAVCLGGWPHIVESANRMKLTIIRGLAIFCGGEIARPGLRRGGNAFGRSRAGYKNGPPAK
jgi:hypothetical protein